jgi:hypothetical protein
MSMASTQTQITDRIQRARDRADQLKYTAVNDEGSVVVCDSAHSDSVHTIVTSELHCSCEDATYRDGPCYHLIGLALFGPDPSATLIQQQITDEMLSIQDETARLRNELRELDEQFTAYQKIRANIESDRTPQQVVSDVQQVLDQQDYPELSDENELETMVAQLTNELGPDY